MTIMRMLKLLTSAFAVVVAGALLPACGNGHAEVRFVHASPDASNVDFAVDGVNQATNLAFPSTNGSYVSITSGNRNVEVRKTGTTSDYVNAANVNFIKHDQYTLFFTGLTTANPANQSVNQVNDDNTAPASGNIKLRIFHASPSGPPCPPPRTDSCIDIYVVAPGADISGLQPNISSLAYQQASGYLNLAAASYEIIVTALGSKSPLIDETPAAFAAGEIRTFVALDVLNGGQISPNLMELSDLN
jgi:hypothetical protein